MKHFTLAEHVKAFQSGERTFENASQGVSRMILEKPVVKINDCGSTKFDYTIFREGKKHIVGLYNEINSFVHFVKDAAEGGTSAEMMFVLIGDVGTGKTFFFIRLCELYRNFLRQEQNRKYTFRFVNLEEIDAYKNFKFIESQTYEDPMVLAMNLLESPNESKEYLCKVLGLSDANLEKVHENYRYLGADSAYILNDIREYAGGDINKMLKHIQIVPIPIDESTGVITALFPANEKTSSSAADLKGAESTKRLFKLEDDNHPYNIDLRCGAIAATACGGIFVKDEFFKHKKDLINVGLRIIQDRVIDINGKKWPIDALLLATSNNAEYDQYRSEEREAPIISRCRTSYATHNTNYILQRELTGYAIGSKSRTTITGEKLHIDPNLNYAVSVAVTLSSLLYSEALTPTETLKLAAGEMAGDKNVKSLREVIDNSNKSPDITKRFGQKGFGQRNLNTLIQILNESVQTNEGECMFACDAFDCFERVVLDYTDDQGDRDKYLKDLKDAKALYRKHIKTEVYNAYREDPESIKKDVLNYINMIIGIDAEDLGPDKMWKYKNPQKNGELTAIKIDETYIDSVEERLGHTTREKKETYRTSIRKIYGQKITTNPEYDFMDNLDLVEAVTEIRLNSDVAGAGSLAGALANRTNEESQAEYNRIMNIMINKDKKMGYCKTCAEKTIEQFLIKDDEI